MNPTTEKLPGLRPSGKVPYARSSKNIFRELSLRGRNRSIIFSLQDLKLLVKRNI
mgnify:CR=1 FL=1